MRARSAAAAIAVAATTAPAFAPAAAPAAWSTPFEMDARPAAAAQAALDARGRAVFVWARSGSFEGGFTQIMARARSANGRWGRRAAMSGVGEFSAVELASGPAGSAVVAWTRTVGGAHRAQGRVRSAAGSLGPVFDVSPAGEDAFVEVAAAGAGGSALFVWRRNLRGADSMRARLRFATGSLGPAIDLSESRHRDVASPGAALLPGGDWLVVWQGGNGRRSRVFGRTVSPGGAAGPVAALSAPGTAAGAVSIGVAADGGALVIWRTAGGRVQARVRHAGGRLGPIAGLSPLATSAERDAPSVAVAPGGRAAVVWNEPGGRGTLRVRARMRSRAGRFGRTIDISDAGRVAVRPQVAIDRAGSAVFAWTEAVDDADATQRRLLSRRLSAAGRLGPIVAVSAPDESASLFAGGLVAGAGGRAAVTWLRSEYLQGAGTRFVAVRAAVLTPGR